MFCKYLIINISPISPISNTTTTRPFLISFGLISFDFASKVVDWLRFGYHHYYMIMPEFVFVGASRSPNHYAADFVKILDFICYSKLETAQPLFVFVIESNEQWLCFAQIFVVSHCCFALVFCLFVITVSTFIFQFIFDFSALLLVIFHSIFNEISLFFLLFTIYLPRFVFYIHTYVHISLTALIFVIWLVRGCWQRQHSTKLSASQP